MAKKSSKKKLRIDFGDVDPEIRKRSRRVPEGDYLAKIAKAEVRKNKDGGGRHILWTFQIVEDVQGKTKYKGVPLWYRTSLKPEALFSLRNVIFSATDGKKNVSGKAIDFDPRTLEGKRIGITVEDHEYENKISSQPVDVMPPSELAEEDEDEEDEDEDEEDEDEDEDEEDDEEDDEDDEEEEDELDEVEDEDL